jgi:hypothetical protein
MEKANKAPRKYKKQVELSQIYVERFLTGKNSRTAPGVLLSCHHLAVKQYIRIFSEKYFTFFSANIWKLSGGLLCLHPS